MEITVDGLTFRFPREWLVSQQDEWKFYRGHFQKIGNTKAIDVLAVDPQSCCWCIEAKDYRRHQRKKTIHLSDEVALKVRDTLACLAAARVNANDHGEKDCARKALRCPQIRVVLVLEQQTNPTRQFQRGIDPADVRQKLKQKVKAIDPHPLVVECGRLGNVPWKVVA